MDSQTVGNHCLCLPPLQRDSDLRASFDQPILRMSATREMTSPGSYGLPTAFLAICVCGLKQAKIF